MKILLINLDRRPDRLALMRERLGALGLDFERVAAVDAKGADFEERVRGMRRDGPLGTIGNGMAACGLSHAKAWQQILDSGAPYALVLEDDAAFSPDLPTFLNAFAAAAPDLALTKLERFRNERGVFIDRSGQQIGGRTVARLRSLHVGGAGYILSRRGAQHCVANFACNNLPIDHYLFNPVCGSVFHALAVHQVSPALIVQAPDVGLRSDTVQSRQIGQHDRWYRMRYHLVRGIHEVQPVLGIGARMLLGQTRFKRLAFA